MRKETDVPDQTESQSGTLTRGDLRLEMEVKNNVLWHAIYDRFGSIKALCHARPRFKNQRGLISELLRFKLSPFKRAWVRDQGWVQGNTFRKICTDLADVLGIPAKDLFPEHLYFHLVGTETSRSVEVDSFSALPRAVRRQILALPAPPETDPEELLEKRELKEETQEVLRTLTPRQRRYVTYRFGLEDGVEHTLEEVGALDGVSKECARQIINRAVRKLQEPARRQRLKPFL